MFPPCLLGWGRVGLPENEHKGRGEKESLKWKGIEEKVGIWEMLVKENISKKDKLNKKNSFIKTYEQYQHF